MANKKVHLRQINQTEKLYHYTKSNGINGIIHTNCFWATKSDFLNDPKEFSYIESIIRSLCDQIIPDKNLRNMFLEDVLVENAIVSGGNREYFILSFSSSRDSITMWSEFGNKTGYNIGMDSIEIIERIKEKNQIDYHGYVIYDPEEQKKIVNEIICVRVPEEFNISFPEILKLGKQNRNNELYTKMCRKIQKMTAVYAMFFKNEAFREEQEYRFIFKKNKATKVLFREKDGFMIPYIQIYLSDELLPIQEIVVAPQNHIDLAKKGMEYMMREKGYHVNIFLSSIKLRY